MAGYIGSIPVPQATQTREAFTATSNQTTFNTGGYTAGFIDVYMNGVKLAAADFTATNGSDVVLASGAAANDIVEVVAYTAFEVLNQNFTGTTTVEALTATGAISGTSADFDGGVTIDNITIDGAEIDLSSGNLLIDVAGDINLDADGGDINFLDGGTVYGFMAKSNNDLLLGNGIQDGDVLIRGNDGGSNVTALSFDMSDAGTAIFNNKIGMGTSSPAYTLSVEKDVDTWVSRIYNTGSDANASGLLVRTDATAAHNAIALGVYADSAYKMVVRSDGNIGIGTTSITSSTSNRTVLELNGASTSLFNLSVGGTRKAYLYHDDSAFYISNVDNTPMQFYTNDTERMRIDASGNVGINCTPDGNSKLQIKGTQEIQATNSTNGWQLYTYTDNTFRVNYNGSGGDEVIINSSGQVGIGDAPNQKFHITGGGSSPQMRITGSSDSWDFYSYTDGALYINNSAGTALGLLANRDAYFNKNVAIGDSSPSSQYDKNLQIHSTSNGGGASLHITDGTSGSSNSDGLHLVVSGGTPYLWNRENTSLVFGTNNTERMRIDSAGRVMIGTTTEGNPAAENLTISDSGHAGMTIRSTDNTSSRIYFSDATSGTGEYTGYLIYDHSNNHMSIATGASERIRIGDSGYVGINNSNPARALQVSAGGMSAAARFDRSSDSSQRGIIEFLSASSGSTVGEIKITSTTAHYTSASDHRLKENVVDLTGATDRLKQLKPKRFNFIADADTTIDGFLAHEAQEIVPEAVSGTKDEVDNEGNPVYQGVDAAKLVPLLVATIKELEARITTLEAN